MDLIDRGPLFGVSEQLPILVTSLLLSFRSWEFTHRQQNPLLCSEYFNFSNLLYLSFKGSLPSNDANALLISNTSFSERKQEVHLKCKGVDWCRALWRPLTLNLLFRSEGIWVSGKHLFPIPIWRICKKKRGNLISCPSVGVPWNSKKGLS